MVIGAILQARMGSSRLPGKVLMPFPFNNGIPLIKYIHNRVKKVQLISDFVVATSEHPDNDILMAYCAKNNMPCIKGSEEDVLSRFCDVIERKKFDIVVRLTGDNPFIDDTILREAISSHMSSGADYTKTLGLPIGMNFEIVNSSALVEANNNTNSLVDREHVTPYIINGGYKKNIIDYDVDSKLSNFRLTIDYPEDYILSSLVAICVSQGSGSLYDKIKTLLNTNSWLFDANKNLVQKQQNLSFKQEKIKAIELLKAMELNKIAKLIEEMNE